MNKAMRLVGSLLVVMAAAAATAQEIDPRARALLAGISGPTEEVRTLQTTSSITYHAEVGQMITTSRLVIDFENRRLVADSESKATFTEELAYSGTIRLVDGELTMTVMGEAFPPPPGTRETYLAMFEQYEMEDLLSSAVRATFDGPVDYGGLLVGDQVSYEGAATLPNLPDVGVIRYVFSDDGTLLGGHMDTELGEMLMLYEGGFSGQNMFASSIISYQLVDGEWQLVMEMRYEDVVINGELDEDLFR